MVQGVPFYTVIILRILTEVDVLLNSYVFNGYTALSEYLRLPLGLVSSIYIALLGYGVMAGWLRLQIQDFLKILFKIGLIYTAVLQWGMVSQYLVGFINSSVGELGDSLIAASPLHIPGVDGIDGAMQLVLIEFTKLGVKLFDSGSLLNFGGWFDGLLIWGFGYLIVGIGLFEIILAKIMLAILFVFTPLLVLFCYFKPFQSIFDRWLGAIVGFALLQLFVTAAMTLALSLAFWWLSIHMGEQAISIGNYGTLPIIIVGVVCIGIIFRAASLAQNLGGMISSSSGAAMVGGFVGSSLGHSSTGFKLVKGTASTAANIGTAGVGATVKVIQKTLRMGG